MEVAEVPILKADLGVSTSKTSTGHQGMKLELANPAPILHPRTG